MSQVSVILAEPLLSESNDVPHIVTTNSTPIIHESTSIEATTTTDDSPTVSRPPYIDAIIKAAVSESARKGNSAEQMFADGVASIYDRLRAQIDDYLQRMDDIGRIFDRSPGAAASEPTQNDIDAVHENLMEYQLPQKETLKAKSYGANVTGDELIDRVAKDVGKVYSDHVHGVYEEANDMFTAMTFLLFDEQPPTGA